MLGPWVRRRPRRIHAPAAQLQAAQRWALSSRPGVDLLRMWYTVEAFVRSTRTRRMGTDLMASWRNELTFEQFLVDAFHYQPHQRRGQAIYNRLYEVRPDLAKHIAGTSADPFMLDERIEGFLDWLERHWSYDGNDESLWAQK